MSRPLPSAVPVVTEADVVRVVQIVTKLALGGAQETVLRCCRLAADPRFDVELVTGPDTDAEGDLFAEAAALGIPVHVVRSLHGPVRPVADVRAAVALIRHLRRTRPDVVHTHSSKAGLLGRLAARVAGVPAVAHTVHGWSFHAGQPGPVRRLYIGLERIAARWATEIVVVTWVDRDRGLAEGIGRPDQYRLIRSAVELDRFPGPRAERDRIRGELGLAPSTPVVGAITRLSPQKDPIVMVRALALLRRDVPDAQLVVAGDGPLRAEVEREAAALGVAGAVHLLGPRRDVPALLAAFDAFAFTSRWEGLPRAVVEAVAAGLPVVAARVGGVPEVVYDDVTGVLVEPGDHDAMAAGLVRVLTDRSLAAARRRAGRAAVATFDSAAMVDAHARLYDRLAGRSPRVLAGSGAPS